MVVDGCQTLDLKEKTFYGSEAASGCVEFYEFSQATIQHPGNYCLDLWNDLNDPMVMMPSSALAQFIKESEDACAQLNNCTEPAIAKAINAAKRSLALLTKIKQKHLEELGLQ